MAKPGSTVTACWTLAGWDIARARWMATVYTSLFQAVVAAAKKWPLVICPNTKEGILATKVITPTRITVSPVLAGRLAGGPCPYGPGPPPARPRGLEVFDLPGATELPSARGRGA